MIRDLGKGGYWYVIARHYPSALMAKHAWERCVAKLDMSGTDRGIGVTRLSSKQETEGPSLLSGLPDDGHPVIAVTLDEKTARKAERLLRDGTEFEPAPDFADAIIYRRARVVAAAKSVGQTTGRIVSRRPDGAGAALDERGRLYEKGGQG